MALAMEPGTILYRTSSDGKMYGFSSKELIRQKAGVMTNIYSGHTGMYVGKVDGVDYVVEALGTGVVMTPAEYFVNENEGELLVAARIPKKATVWQRAKAVAIGKYLARSSLAYDFDFSSQKGPWSGDWTCVGLTEKLYESANASNPEKLGALEYDPRYYAVDITPDGYDRESIYSPQGDVFSRGQEFSQIARRNLTILPAPEILGYNAGKVIEGDRFLFIPYTQAVQKSLIDVPVDVDLSSRFPDAEVRGKVNNLGVVLKWSLINNPISGLRSVADEVRRQWDAIFPAKSEADRLAWGGGNESPTPLAGEESKQVQGNMSAEINPVFEQALEKAKPAVGEKVKEKTEETGVEKEAAEVKHPQAQPSVLETDIFASARPKTQSPQSVVPKEQKTETKDTNIALWTPLVKEEEKKETVKEKEQEETSKESKEEEKEISDDLVISRIHTQGDDDWIEIWNYGDEDIDLAAAKIRLEKAKSASDPGIMLRFEAASDATFPGGTLLRAGEGYRIVRDDASPDLKQAASAIALRSDFSLTDKGFTIYLAKGAVSSPVDEDIIDKVGFGEAAYYEGSGPAPALSEGYLLRRKADSSTKIEEILEDGSKENWPPKYDNDDNARDFLLWPLGGRLPQEEEEEEKEDNDNGEAGEDNDNETEEGDDGEEETDTGTDGDYAQVEGIDSPDLMRLWAFNECDSAGSADSISRATSGYLESEGKRAVGQFGCGMFLPYQDKRLRAAMTPMLDGGGFSFAFRFKGKDNYSNPSFMLENSSDNTFLKFDLFSSMAEFHGFPGLEGRYNMPNFMDNEWHQAVLIWNARGGNWSLHIDGEELFYQEFGGLAAGYDRFSIAGVSGEVVVDELAFWNRVLSGTEIKSYAASVRPFNPIVRRNPPPELKLEHQWEFDEVTGSVAHDIVGSLDWQLPAGAIVFTGKEGKGLDYPKDVPYKLQIPEISSEGFSFSLWWKNEATLPYSGRLHIDLNDSETNLAQLSMEGGRQVIKSVGNDDIFVENPSAIPLDNLWHHIVLTYDDYLWRWKVFVDGKLMIDQERLPLPASAIDNIQLSSTSWGHKIDKFKIWKGTMTTEKAQSEYDSER